MLRLGASVGKVLCRCVFSVLLGGYGGVDFLVISNRETARPFHGPCLLNVASYRNHLGCFFFSNVHPYVHVCVRV